MSYGLETENSSGRTLIDESSRQVQIVKSGSIVPKPIGYGYSASLNPFRFGGSANPIPSPILVPGLGQESLVFIKPRRTSGSSNTALHVGVQYGTATIVWTSTQATIIGTNYVYATYATSSASMPFSLNYIGNAYSSTVVNESPTVDTLGSVIGYAANGLGNNTGSTRILNIETTATSGVYKLTISGTWGASKPTGTNSFTLDREVVWFYTPNNGGFVSSFSYGSSEQNQWILDYKFGTLSDNAEESAGYGLEIFTSAGRMAFSSNRVNFQIEKTVTGPTDIEAGTALGSWAYGSGVSSPVIHTTVDSPSTFSDYYIMVTGSGNTSGFVKGTNNNGVGGNPHAISFGVGYAFCPLGQRFFNNATMAGPAGGDQVDTVSISNTEAGMSMSPIYQSFYGDAPAGAGGSYVSDTWAIEATRTLIIGKFV